MESSPILYEASHSLLPGYAPKIWRGQRGKKAAVLVAKLILGSVCMVWISRCWRQRCLQTEYALMGAMISGVYIIYPIQSLAILGWNSR